MGWVRQLGEWRGKVEWPTISQLLTQVADAMCLALCSSMSAKCRLSDPTNIYRASTMGQAGTSLWYRRELDKVPVSNGSFSRVREKISKHKYNTSDGKRYNKKPLDKGTE